MAPDINSLKLERLIAYCDTATNATELMVIHKGKVVAEWRNDCDSVFMKTASMVKSWTGLLTGILIDQGIIDSVDAPVSKYLPDWEPAVENNITIRHLLTMTAGIDRRSGSSGILAENDMKKYLLDFKPDTLPGVRFAYSNESVQLLGMVIESATGESANAVFHKYLFGPLEMDSTNLVSDRAGNDIVFGGTITTIRDAAKIGLLMMQNGRYKGEQIISENWLKASTSPGHLASFYGYLWWIDNTPGLKNFAATGDGGQLTIVFPDLDLIFLRRQSCYPHGGHQMPWMGPAFLEMIADIVNTPSNSADNIPVIESTTSSIDIRDGEKLQKNNWNLAPEVKPDVYTAGLINGKPHTVTFYTDIDSISFFVELGKKYDFIIKWGDKLCYQQIEGQAYEHPVNFDEDYQEATRGKIFVRIPQVYEMVNIAIAISEYGREQKYKVYKSSDYYQKVMDWFGEYDKHPFIQKLDSVFELNGNYYASYKMNGYAFNFDDNGVIHRSKVYNRTGFRDQKDNKLLPFLKEMQDFADKTEFLDFYNQNKAIYDAQITVYRDSIGLDEMQRWLEKNFPGNSAYDTYNIIFSPLVGGSQSSTWFESNGFKELQPHVNFPYYAALKGLLPLSKVAEYCFRGNIVFTEINHGYINPEGDKYYEKIAQAISNRDAWVEASKGANYYSGNSLFNEYMNWALINLRITDYVSEDEQDKLIKNVERTMVKGRGFLKFEEFNHFLLTKYRERNDTTTIADLYPQIIEWFDKQNDNFLKQRIIELCSPIQSIDFSDENYSDLDFLKEVLKDNRVLILGEPSHGDGSVFSAKNRIIKFLHREMDYDVLVFESGFYDLYGSNEADLTESEFLELAEKNVFRVWSQSNEAWPILKYASETSLGSNPLLLSGMDIQFTTKESDYTSELLQFLEKNELLDREKDEAFHYILKKLLNDHLFTPDSLSQQEFINRLDFLEGKIQKICSVSQGEISVENEFWLQNIKNIRALALTPWNQDLGYRERQMADNLIWLADRKYPDKKIIVWVASVYSFTNRETINTMKPDFNYSGQSMGDLLSKRFNKQLYNLAFTANEGEYGAFYWNNTSKKLDPPNKFSMEYYLESTKLNYCWLDFSTINKTEQILRQNIVARPLGYSEMRADWTRICDGIFYIKSMEPSTKRNN